MTEFSVIFSIEGDKMMKLDGKKIFVFLSGCALAVFFALNFITYYCMDDYSYMFNFVTKERLSSLKDIFQSLSIHYTNVNGRMVTHFFAHLFCFFGKSVFNVVNTIAFGVLCAAIGKNISKKFDARVFFVVICALFILVPDFGQSFLWMTGASNYLLGVLIGALYLIPISRGMEDGVKYSYGQIVGIFLLGVVSGATLENMSVMLCCFSFFVICYHAVKNRRVPLYPVLGLVGNIIGFLTVVLAPGQRMRLDNTGAENSVSVILSRISPISESIADYLLPILLLDAVLVLCFILKKGEKDKTAFVKAVFFFVSGMSGLYCMAASPQFPLRVWSGPVCMVVIATGLFIASLEIKKYGWVKNVLSAVCLVIFAFTAYDGAVNLKITNDALITRDTAAKEQIADGERELSLDIVCGSGNKFDPQPTYGDITDNSAVWTNVALARYYGIDAVVGK